MNPSNNIIDQLFEKIDKLDDRLDSVEKHLAVYNAELKTHIEGVVQNRSFVKKIDQDIQPLKKHVYMVEGGLKLLGILSLLSGLAYSVFKILG